MVASNLSGNNSTTSNDNSSFIKESKTDTIVESSSIHLSESSTENNTEKSEESQATEVSQQDNIPTDYKNALTRAENYSSLMYMSKQGIYDQLTSEYGEQFSPEAGQYAIDNLNVDYNLT